MREELDWVPKQGINMILKTSINNVSSFYLGSINNVIKVSDKYRDYLNKVKMHN